MADGLASNEILGILEDRSGNLWLMTNEGLSRFTPRTRQIRNYDVSDGLQSREFHGRRLLQKPERARCSSAARTVSTSFFPQNIFDNGYVPPVRITSFKVLNKEVKLPKPIWETAEIVLSPKDYLFSFEFAALDYSAPEKNQYAYKLEGLTEDWIYTDARRRLASFSLLPPGKYVFRVKGSNSDGLWNEQDVSLVIRMLAPWWRSWWLLALLTTLVALLLYEWSRTRIRRMGGAGAHRGRQGPALRQGQHLAARERDRRPAFEGRANKEIAARTVHRAQHGEDPRPSYFPQARRAQPRPAAAALSELECPVSQQIPAPEAGGKVPQNLSGNPIRESEHKTAVRLARILFGGDVAGIVKPASCAKRQAALMLMFLLLALCLRPAQRAEDARFVHFSRDEGLSQNAVTSILQDHHGFMWIGTESGLNRFDGYEFAVFTEQGGDPARLSHNYITALHEDRDGILWIGTFNGGLNRYDPQKG